MKEKLYYIFYALLCELEHVCHGFWNYQLVRHLLLGDHTHAVFPPHPDTGHSTIVDCLECIFFFFGKKGRTDR